MLNKYNTAGIWRRLVPGYETVTLRVRNTIDGVATYRDYTIAHTKGRPTSTGESPIEVGLLRLVCGPNAGRCGGMP